MSMLRFVTLLAHNIVYNMRIGIITHQLFSNYGGILQAFALQKVLTGMGHEAEVVQFRKDAKISFAKKVIAYPKRAFEKYMLRKPHIEIRFEEKWNRLRREMTKNVTPFIENNIKCRFFSDFKNINEHDFDVLVVGSDQVWRTRYYSNIGFSFFDFAESWNIKRISYAASFGIDYWDYSAQDTEKCKSLIHKFDAVSVRESSGIKLCKKYLGYDDAVLVLDPTTLLPKEIYQELSDKQRYNYSGGLFYYILDKSKEKTNVVQYLSKKMSLPAFSVNSEIENPNAPLEERIHPAVEEWIQAFDKAKYVVTDSFHGTVFSILFHKEFVVISNSKRGNTRLESLLTLFGLEARMICSESDIDVLEPIDYSIVDDKLQQYRDSSFSFLKDALQ